MILDVGCGKHKAHGDFGIDLDKNSSADLICDVSKGLSFLNNSFDHVKCYHCLEHLDNPIFLLKEMLQVAKYNVHIKVPHYLSPNARISDHKQVFNRKWFFQVLKNYPIEMRTNVMTKYLISNIPNEIEVTIWK